MIKLIKYLYRLNTIVFILIGFSLEVTISIIFGIILPAKYSKNPVIDSIAKDESTLFLFVFGCFIAPLFETFLFQYLPFQLIKIFSKHNKLKYRRILYLTLASLAFGYMHYFNFFYFLAGCLVGFIFCFFFYLSKLRRQNGLILVTIIHSLNNFIALLGTLN